MAKRRSDDTALFVVLGAAATAAVIFAPRRVRDLGVLPPLVLPSAESAPLPFSIPDGWRRYQGPVTPAMADAASLLLNSGAPIGAIATIGGVTGLVERHYDDAKGWHRGVSVLVGE